jgi:dipeptidyl aminopeptidase/acylaminoacyl peptidase
MNISAWRAVPLLVLLTVISPEASAASRRLVVDDVVSLSRITAVELSPDGARLAYIIEQPNDEKHSKLPPEAKCWIYSVKDGALQPVESGGRLRLPKWSPDSRLLAFLSPGPGGNTTRLCLLDPDRRQQRQLTEHAKPVQSFAWSHDGSKITLICQTTIPDGQKRRHELGYDELHVGPGPDQEGPGEELWTVSVDDGRERQVDTRGVHLLANELSPDGLVWLLSTASSRWADDAALRPRLVTLDALGGEARPYCQVTGRFISPTWSPDGLLVAYLGTTEGAVDPYPGGLYVCRGRFDTPRNLIAGADFTVEQYRWIESGKAMVIVGARGVHRFMARLDVVDGRLTPITRPPIEVAFRSPYSVSTDGTRIAGVLATDKTPPDIWLIEKNGQTKQVTHANPQVESIQFADGEEFLWKARDGLGITGVLLKPVGYRPGVRYPLITQVHGSQVGDMNEFQATWMNWGQLLASNGYAVLLPNYRGSLTSGAHFARANQGDLGGKDLSDILDGIDALVESGIADPDRLGIGGVSYGGFLTAWAITQTKRFKAAVMGLGISDWISMAGETPTPEAMVDLYWKHSPYEEWQLLWNRSPLAYTRNVRTPVLIYSGEHDPLVPVSQSRQFFRALQHYGVPTEFIVYPREGHSVTEPNHLRDNLTRIVEWFDHYLK